MTDLDLRKNVESELHWEASVDAAEIEIASKAGVVTLSGSVQSYWERTAAEQATLRVFGVKAIANELEIRLPSASERTDEDLARAAANVLDSSSSVPPKRITAQVSKGWLTLKGTVDWRYQKTTAEEAVRYLLGVKGLSNLVEVKPQASTTEARGAIEAALKRHWDFDAHRIRVEENGEKITLRGAVRSWFERNEAEHVAWAAPGVRTVDNQITIGPFAAGA